MRAALLVLAFSVLLCPLPMVAQTSSAETGPFTAATPTAAAPVWLKLVGAGSTFTGYYATGTTAPTTWTQMGKGVSITLANPARMMGLFICSHDASSKSTATIDNVSISASGPLLEDNDIGGPALLGSLTLGSPMTLVGSGADIWGTTDQFHFAPYLITGDFTAICRITSISGGQPWQKAGLMIRDSWNSGSAYAAAMITQNSGADFQYRTASNNNPPTVITTPVNGFALTGTNVQFYEVHP